MYIHTFLKAVLLKLLYWFYLQNKEKMPTFVNSQAKQCDVDLPIIDMGFVANLMRPLMPMYLLRHPADHSRTTYSTPKNTTSTISCNIYQDM